MKTIKRTLTLLILVQFAVFTSCSGNDDETPQEEELSQVVMKEFKEKVAKLTPPTGLKNSNNQYAQQANAQFTSVKGIAQGFATLLTIPSSAVSSGVSGRGVQSTKTYTWSANGTTVKYAVTEMSDRYTFVYTVTHNGNSHKVMDGFQKKDGSYAEAKMYDNNVVASTIKWWVNGDMVKIEVTTDMISLILESNTADNSGNIKVYESTILAAEYIWKADGSGRYTNHLTNQTFNW